MKKVFFLFLAVICLVAIIGCAGKDTPLEIPKDAIIIDGAEIYRKYAVLPLCDVIEALGFELTHNGDSASFYFNNIEYVISITEKTFTTAGDDENYLICPPGSKHFVCEISNGDLMVDDGTVHALFFTFLEYPIEIIIDRANNRVAVAKK
jgi:hypothetical protein